MRTRSKSRIEQHQHQYQYNPSRWLAMPSVFMIVYLITLYRGYSFCGTLFHTTKPATLPNTPQHAQSLSLSFNNVIDAFKGGAIVAMFSAECCDNPSSRNDIAWMWSCASYRNTISDFLNHKIDPNFNVTQFCKVLSTLDFDDKTTFIDTSENSKPLAVRVAGYITIANCLFVAAVMALLVSIIPLVLKIIVPIVQTFGKDIVNAFIYFMPLYEYIAYSASYTTLLFGISLRSTNGHFIAFLGCGCCVVSYCYSVYLYAPSDGNRQKQFMAFTGMYVCVLYGAAALFFDSSLLGFFGCIGLCTALGFTIVPHVLCTYIGFNSEEQLMNAVVTLWCFMSVACGTIAAEFHGIQFFIDHNWIFEPFRFGIFSLGGTVFFIAHLIMSSGRWCTENDFSIKNVSYIFNVIVFFCFGALYNVSALTNTAATFAVLYGMEKYTEMMYRSRTWFWLYTFIGSIVCIFLSLWLMSHPDFVVGMFQNKIAH